MSWLAFSDYLLAMLNYLGQKEKEKSFKNNPVEKTAFGI
jgi:hypothetical protein